MSDAIRGVISRFSSLADGTIRYQIDVAPEDDNTAFHSVGQAVALAGLAEAGKMALATPEPESAPEALYGSQAKSLRLSGFFARPNVWSLIGSDREFLGWLKHQKCVASRRDACQGDVVPAHVRRIRSGAGKGKKPEYSAIPLCHKHHSLQHEQGEDAIGGKEHCDRQRVRALEDWCWATLKVKLGYQHWNQVPPEKLLGWAEKKGVAALLPVAYKEAA